MVPGRVRLLAEVRSAEAAVLDRLSAGLSAGLLAAVEGVRDARGVAFSLTPVSTAAPVLVPAAFVAAQTATVRAMGHEPVLLASGAGHDGNQIAAIAPVGMFFAPGGEGGSHAPEEWAEVADVAAGAEALGRTLLALDRAWCAGRGEASGR